MKSNTSTLHITGKKVINSYYPDMDEWTEGQTYAAQGRRLRAA